MADAIYIPSTIDDISGLADALNSGSKTAEATPLRMTWTGSPVCPFVFRRQNQWDIPNVITGTGSPTDITTQYGVGVNDVSYNEMGLTTANIFNLTSLTFDNLQYAGLINIASTIALSSGPFSELKYCAGNLGFASMTGIVSISCPKLEYVGGTFTHNSMATLTTYNFPLLRYVGSNFIPGNMSALSGTLSFPSLEVVVGSSGFGASSIPLCTGLDFHSLRKVIGPFMPNGFTGLNGSSVVDFSALEIIAGGMTLTAFASGGNPLTTLEFPSLTFIGASTTLTNVHTRTLSLSSMVNYNGAATQTGTSFMNTVTLGTIGTLKRLNGNLAFNNTAMGQSSVDNMLAMLVSLDGNNGTTLYSGKTVNIGGGTASAPTFTGTTMSSAVDANHTFSGTSITCTGIWTNHGLSVGDLITVDGISGLPSANTAGAYVLSVPDANTFTYQKSAGSGTAAGTPRIRRSGAVKSTNDIDGSHFFVDNGTRCDVTWTGHGLSTGDVILVGSTSVANGVYKVVVDDADHYHYAKSASTGVVTGTAVVIKTEGFFNKQYLYAAVAAPLPQTKEFQECGE